MEDLGCECDLSTKKKKKTVRWWREQKLFLPKKEGKSGFLIFLFLLLFHLWRLERIVGREVDVEEEQPALKGAV
jgi:hypothetical protein